MAFVHDYMNRTQFISVHVGVITAVSVFAVTSLFHLHNENWVPSAEATTTNCPVLPTGKGVVTSSVTLSGGTYKVWSRVMPQSSTANSYYLQVDNNCAIKVGGSSSIPANAWTWVDYKDGTATNKITMNLSAGWHVVRLSENAPGFRLDKLIFTTDTACVPTGVGSNCNAVAVSPTNRPTVLATTAPGATLFDVQLALHGIGKGGDNANPIGIGNTSPRTPQRQVTVEVINSQNAVVLTKQGTVMYDAAAGLFKGTIDMGNTLPTGYYTIRVSSNKYLKKLVTGVQYITAGSRITVAQTTLITGDAASDNTVNILDYNMIMGCFSDLKPAVNCPAGNKEKSDLTDDGFVNQLDFNLFMRELTNRAGN
jgi:hypothetical protein